MLPDSNYNDFSDDQVLRLYSERMLRHEKLVSLNAPKKVIENERVLVDQMKREVMRRGLTLDQIKDAISLSAARASVLDATTKTYEVTLKITLTAAYIGPDLTSLDAKERLVEPIASHIDSAKDVYPTAIIDGIVSIKQLEG